MAEPATALVWFKRDLRLRDHAPLAEATRFERVLALVLIEPAWLDSPECHPRHVAYLLACLAPLREALAARGLPLLVRVGEAVTVLEALRRTHGVSHLLSHEETGPGWSYTRDKAVAAWCRAQGVAWLEWPQTGVVRRLRSRSGWAAQWACRMQAAPLPRPAGWAGLPGLAPEPLPTLADLGLSGPVPALPPAGEAAAWAGLGSFLQGRAAGYRRALSSPLSAETGCSRLSEHLAFGTVSMRCVFQATERARRATADASLACDLTSFGARLRWHCHFMQKLEDEPAVEWRNFSRAHDGLRPGDAGCEAPWRQDLFEAWCEGRTGYPMVDACMRQLRATGWLNFRMRAMLVSFAAYHLWLHWRAPGLFLARQFLDFEPGIHWSQMQMQSGTTGINTLRIYSPAKQAAEHDPEGRYRRRWLPEWGTPAYPAPVVDEAAVLARAKTVLYGLRQQAEVRAEARAIQDRHGSRRAGLPPTAARRVRQAAPPSPQMTFW